MANYAVGIRKFDNNPGAGPHIYIANKNVDPLYQTWWLDTSARARLLAMALNKAADYMDRHGFEEIRIGS